MGSEGWARATATAFDLLTRDECAKVAKPEWWNDEGLLALSLKVVRAVPNEVATNNMRARVLSGYSAAWEVGPRSAAEILKAATHYDQAAVLCPAPAVTADFTNDADVCREHSQAKEQESSLRLFLDYSSAPPPKGKKKTTGRKEKTTG